MKSVERLISNHSLYMKNKSILPATLLFFCLSLASSVHGQDESPSVAPVAQEDAGASSAASAVSEPFQAKEDSKITALEITGNKSISTNVILAKIKAKVGAPYQENVVSDDIKRLYLLGFFSDINTDMQPYKDGVKLVFSVTERPIIEKVSFSGIKRLPMKEDKIKTLLKTRESQYLDYPALSEDASTLRSQYEKRGYSNAKVEYETDFNKENGKALITFKVREGIKTKIRDIFVQGNQAYRTGRLLKIMKTKHAWLFNSGILKEDVLKEDMERLKLFYQRNGYADAAVSYEVVPNKHRNYLSVVVKVTEGKKYIVGELKVEGNKEIQLKDIMARLKICLPFKVFSQEGMREDIASLQGLYFDRGYIFVNIRESTSVNIITGRVDIVYRIIENDIGYVNKIKIRGNVKTRDVVIRRELRIKPGERFDGDKLRRSKERLQNLGFFEEVSYDTEDTDVPNHKDLVVDVKEAKTGAFSFGGGYSSVDKLVGFVEVEQKNFDWKNFPYFTGGGQDLKLRASMGSLSQGYTLSYTNPWVFDYPVSFGFDLYKRIHERDSDVGYGYDEDISGGDLRLGKELTEYTKADLMYKYETINISNINETASQDLKNEEGTNAISSVGMGLTYDSRDNVFDPRRGELLSGNLDIAGGPLGGDKDFTKVFGRASHYQPLFLRSVLEFRVRGGVVKAYDDSLSVPIYERFFAGGANTIRGYRERKIGPVDSGSGDPLGGEAFLVANAEYTYPLMDFLRLAFFYDVGNVWAKSSDFASGGFMSGTGIGVRIKTPIGPLMLDYGIPLDKEPGQDTKGGGRFHFNMSHGF